MRNICIKWIRRVACCGAWSCTVGLGLLLSLHGEAVALIIGPLRPIDVFAIQAGDVAADASKVNRSKAEFNRQIDEARRAYHGNPKDRAAEQVLARLLWDKDWYFVALRLNSLDGRDAASALDSIIGGKPLDGGIDPLVQAAFVDWVRTIRSGLGARSDRALVIILDEASVRKAVKDSEPAYRKYRERRDALELENHAFGNGLGLPWNRVLASCLAGGNSAMHCRCQVGRLRQVRLEAKELDLLTDGYRVKMLHAANPLVFQQVDTLSCTNLVLADLPDWRPEPIKAAAAGNLALSKGSTDLLKQEAVRFHPGHMVGGKGDWPFREKYLNRLIGAPEKMLLVCQYSVVKDGRELVGKEVFWNESPPANIEEMLAEDRGRDLGTLGKAALRECPGTYAEAQRRSRESRNVASLARPEQSPTAPVTAAAPAAVTLPPRGTAAGTSLPASSGNSGVSGPSIGDLARERREKRLADARARSEAARSERAARLQDQRGYRAARAQERELSRGSR